MNSGRTIHLFPGRRVHFLAPLRRLDRVAAVAHAHDLQLLKLLKPRKSRNEEGGNQEREKKSAIRCTLFLHRAKGEEIIALCGSKPSSRNIGTIKYRYSGHVNHWNHSPTPSSRTDTKLYQGNVWARSATFTQASLSQEREIRINS